MLKFPQPAKSLEFLGHILWSIVGYDCFRDTLKSKMGFIFFIAVVDVSDE